MRPEDALPKLRELGFAEPDAQVLADHFLEAERRGKQGHGLERIEWLAGQDVDAEARPERLVAEEGFERWDGRGALGYLTLAAICESQIASPPEHARVVAARNCFPTGTLGYWTRKLAGAGLVAALTATSPARLAHPDGGPPLTGTNPLSIAVPSSEGGPIVVDVSMGKVTYGDVIAGIASEAELVPFGGEHAHKAFALALGLQLLVDALIGSTGKAGRASSGRRRGGGALFGSTGKAGRAFSGRRRGGGALFGSTGKAGRASSGWRRRGGALVADGYGALLLVARPEADPVPDVRRLAGGLRLPGDGPPTKA